MRVFGICGWKNSGKTTLTEALVGVFVRQGFRVATVKHAHHEADLDHPGTDSFRHRAAGASQVLLATPVRWALITELAGAPEPPLAALLARLDPCDLVLIEGFKHAPHPKIEAFFVAEGTHIPQRSPLARSNPTVRAIASNLPAEAPVFAGLAQPILPLHALDELAHFVLAQAIEANG